jgi:epoxide hydrolase
MNSRPVRSAFSLAMVLSVVTAASSNGGGAQAALLPPVRVPAQASNNAAVVPFAIHVPDDVLKDLKARLARTRFPDELDGASWDYGMNLGYLKGLVEYWRDRFDWRAQERRLNQFSQFKTRIDGLDIHFIHQRSKNPNALPLLLLNGWPSSIDEYNKVIGPLTDPASYGGRAEDAFHVVIPSMPGYGFSDKPRERGYGNDRITADWTTLMARLGYSRYGTQGTDIGAGIATQLAVDDKAHVVGLHLTGCGGAPPAPAGATAPLDTQGYFEQQATKPQTVGYSLSDSPVGLAAWIVEKYHGWTDHEGLLERPVAHSGHDLLGHRQRRIIGADLLRTPPSTGWSHHARDCPDWMRELQRAVRQTAGGRLAKQRRGAFQHRPMERHASRRTLPRLRGTAGMGG